jgi:hypothetical protein
MPVSGKSTESRIFAFQWKNIEKLQISFIPQGVVENYYPTLPREIY